VLWLSLRTGKAQREQLAQAFSKGLIRHPKNAEKLLKITYATAACFNVKEGFCFGYFVN
jgi:hypothetical protein